MSAPERQFSTGGHDYVAARLSVFDQFNLAADFRGSASAIAIMRANRAADTSDDQFKEALRFIITGGARDVPPETRERTLRNCLGVVKRRDGAGWQSLINPSGSLQYDDVGLPELVQIIYEVFVHNGIVDFFSVSPSAPGDNQQERSGPSPTVNSGS